MIIGCIVIYTPLILWYFLCCHKLWINVVEDPGVNPASAFVAYYYSLYYHCSWFKVHAVQNIIWNIKWVIFISLETVAIDTIKKCPIRKTFAFKKNNYLAGQSK